MEWGEKQLPIIDYAAIAGPKRELVVRRLTQTVLSNGDTMVLGSMQVVRNRFRGKFRPGWLAKCQAIQGGQAHGFGYVYEVVPRFEAERRMQQLRLSISN